MFQHDMFKGFLGFNLINDDLETIFNNSLDSSCNYNIKLVLSDIHHLMNEYKNEKKNVVLSMLNNINIIKRIVFYDLICIFLEKPEKGEFNRKFPDSEASYFTHVDIKKIRLLLKKIEYYLSWVNENELKK